MEANCKNRSSKQEMISKHVLLITDCQNGALKEIRFRLDIQKKFFPRRVVRHWPRLPREAVAAPSLAGLKARLDGALSNLGWWKMSLLVAAGLEPDDL